VRVTDPERQHWESLCHRCGQCCFEKKIDEQGRVHPTRTPCRFLDIHSRLCRVYSQRITAEADCIPLTPETVAELDWLPSDCAYVKWLGQHVKEEPG